jgi:hypothetical protein
MSAVALHLYEKLNEAPDDKARSKAIVEAFSELEERYPNLREVATQRNLGETELRLQKEIEKTRLEIKTVETNLQKEIEKTRLEIKTVEANLQKEIEKTRLEIKTVEANLQKEIKIVEGSLQKEIEKTRIEIKQIEVNFSKTVHQQTLWVIGSVGTIVMGLRLLEWFLEHIAR